MSLTGKTATSRHVGANVRFQGHRGTARHREDRITLPRITIWNAAFNIGRCSALRLFPSATLEITDHQCRVEALPVCAV